MDTIKIEKYQKGQEIEIHELIKKVYDEFDSIDYSEEGNKFFYDWIESSRIVERQKDQNNLLVALMDSKIVGMIEIRDNKNISLLFVAFYASQKYYGNVIYGVAKAAVDKMTMDMSEELKKHKITSVSLYPGYIDDKKSKNKPNPKKETSIFVGRAIRALASDNDVLKKTGQILVAADLAKEYDFTDIDGIQPEPFDKLR